MRENWKKRKEERKDKFSGCPSMAGRLASCSIYINKDYFQYLKKTMVFSHISLFFSYIYKTVPAF